MVATSKYFVTLSPGSNLLDFDLAYGSLLLQGQDLVFTGTNGIDNVTVAPGVIFDFTKSNGGIDNIYLTGNLTDYTSVYTTSTVTLTRGMGASAEVVLLAKGTLGNYDNVVFANGTASTFDLHGWASGGALPTLSAAPALPTTLNATVKGFALDATGETFTGTSPGINFIATGGNGVDIVYVKAGATVDASKLNSGEDKIYLTGNWVDYTKTATSTKITFTNGTETVIVAAATGASNDRLIFADGYVLSNDAKTALLSNANAAIATVTGYSTAEVTPLPGPSVTITTNDSALKIGDVATLTFTLSEASTTFTEADVAVTGGALTNFAAVSSTVYTASFTPAASSTTAATVSVAGGTFTNAASQSNVASQQLSMAVDTVAPVAATIGTVATNDVIDATERAAGVTVTGTNEAGATVTLNGNAVTPLTGTTWSYNLVTAAIDAFGQGFETLTVVSTDAAGNTASSTPQVITVDSRSVSYGTTTFTEAAANDGTITATSTITLIGDTFTGANGAALTGAVVSNVPAGLTAVVTKVTDTTAILSLTGSATAHANVNDITNLTVTMSSAAFTLGTATGVTGATTANLIIDFADPLTRSVSYSATTLAEAAANDGTITATSTITLIGDTFTGANDAALTGAAVTNVPAGLTAVVTKTSATTATLSFTGSAASHANANDIGNLTVTLSNGAFTLGNATSVTGATTSTLAINFADPARTVSYGTTTFTEAAANDGTITATSTITLTGDTFTGANGAALTGAVVSNVPTGLTAVVTKASATTATLSFTGSAAAHANANDVSDLTVTMSSAAFTLGTATGVTGATKSDLIIDFADPLVRTVSYSAATLDEAAANDGSITATLTITLSGDTFVGANDAALTGAVVSNVPTGLTAVVTKTSATTATLSFTGSAAAHANAQDIGNLTVTLSNGAFTLGSAASVTGATKSDLAINFADPVRTVSYGATTFTEAAANDGTITATSTITLSGDTFAGSDGQALTGAVVSNVPTGLTAVVTKASATTATLSFTGNATAHANAQDVSNLTVALGDAAFTLANAAGVTGATKSDLAINFADVGAILNGDAGPNTLIGASANNIIYGGGGADTINGGAGNDTIDITDTGTTAASSASIAFTDTVNGTDTIIGFSAAAVASGGDKLDFSAIAGLVDAVATGQTLATDFGASNVFIFNGTPVTVADAASAIAAGASVVATVGYIVIADSANSNAVTVYHSTDLAANGTETALAILSGVTITNLTAANFIV